MHIQLEIKEFTLKKNQEFSGIVLVPEIVGR